MKPITVYSRVSTEEQNLEGQRAEIEAWLKRNGIDLNAVEWIEEKESGKTLNRPEFQRLERAVVKGEVTTVIVYKVDRLARTMLDGMNTLAKWAELGCRVVSVTQHIDVSGVMGKIIAAILFGFSEMEMEYRVERQKAGITAAKARGVYKGRVKGSTKAKPKRAHALRAKGLQIGEIAEALGCSVRTAHRYLTLPA